METKVLREENRGNVNGYQIIIKNLDTGEVEVDETTRAIIGAFETKTPEEDCIGAQSIVVTSCNTATLISVIEAADKVIKTTKKRVIEGVVGDSPIAALLAMLGDKK